MFDLIMSALWLITVIALVVTAAIDRRRIRNLERFVYSSRRDTEGRSPGGRE